MIFDEVEESDTPESIRTARDDAQRLVILWDRRALYATLAFALSCASVVPFLAGHTLHAYWDSFGKYLVLVSMALLIPSVACVGTAISTRLYRRSVTRISLD